MLLTPTVNPPLFPAGSVGLPPPAGSDVKPYVFAIVPSGPSNLVLSHGSASLTVVDQTSLQIVDTWTCAEKEAEVTSIVVNGGAGASGEVWTAGKDGFVRTWDARVKGGRIDSGNARPMRVPGGKVTPLLSLAYAPEHHLLAAGTELTNHEASVVYWDPRAPANPLYAHTTIHSDDITTLSFAPSSLHHLSFPLEPASPSDEPRAPPSTSAILLSGSTDGTLSLTDAKEQDEDEAQLGVGNVGVSVAEAGWTGKGWEVWGRDDMDGVSVWDASDFTAKLQEPTLRLATIEGTAEAQEWNTDYLITLLPSLPSATTDLPLSLVGSNSGHIALLDRLSEDEITLKQRLNSTHRGHRDVVRSAYYNAAAGRLYTGSEDGMLCAWTLAPPTVASADVDMDASSSSSSDASSSDEDDAMDDVEPVGGKRRRGKEEQPSAPLGGDGGWANVKRNRRDR